MTETVMQIPVPGTESVRARTTGSWEFSITYNHDATVPLTIPMTIVSLGTTDAKLIGRIRDVIARWEAPEVYGRRGFTDDGALRQIARLLEHGPDTTPLDPV